MGKKKRLNRPAAVVITAKKADQQIQWADPAPVVYGTRLGAAQLNAATSGDGALTYNPAAGATLGVGTHTLTVTAAETANFRSATGTVQLTVTKADPRIDWPDLAPIVYGTPLSAAQLRATAEGGGALSYNPAEGAKLGAGAHTLTVTVAETANYNSATKSVTLVVGKAEQQITWGEPPSIVFGTLLGATQLNASTNGDGVLSYNPAAGAKLDAGRHALTVTAAETANYRSATKTVQLTVARAEQQIQWVAPAPIVYGALLGAEQLNAATSGDGALTYNPVAGAKLGAGTHVLTVTAAETANYEAATKSVPLVVEKATRTITCKPAWPPLEYDSQRTFLQHLQAAPSVEPALEPGERIEVGRQAGAAIQPITPVQVPPFGRHEIHLRVAESPNFHGVQDRIEVLVLPTVAQWLERLQFVPRTNLYMMALTDTVNVDGKPRALHLSMFRSGLPKSIPYGTAQQVLDDLFPDGKGGGFHLTVEYWGPADTLSKNPHLFKGSASSADLFVGQGISLNAKERDALFNKLNKILTSQLTALRSAIYQTGVTRGLS